MGASWEPPGDLLGASEPPGASRAPPGPVGLDIFDCLKVLKPKIVIFLWFLLGFEDLAVEPDRKVVKTLGFLRGLGRKCWFSLGFC